MEDTDMDDAPNQVKAWIERKYIKVLNVGGPRTGKDPMIYQATMALLETAWYLQ
jgi:hypothetical protein